MGNSPLKKVVNVVSGGKTTTMLPVTLSLIGKATKKPPAVTTPPVQPESQSVEPIVLPETVQPVIAPPNVPNVIDVPQPQPTTPVPATSTASPNWPLIVGGIVALGGVAFAITRPKKE